MELHYETPRSICHGRRRDTGFSLGFVLIYTGYCYLYGLLLLFLQLQLQLQEFGMSLHMDVYVGSIVTR
jgi:hypothetical protein